MELVNNILFWIHLTSLALGGAAAFGIPVVASRMPKVAAEVRPTLMQIIKGISTVGRVGLGLLIVTGPLMVWLKYGGFGGFGTWFWVKMALIVVLLAGVIYSGILGKRADAGGPPSPMMARIGMINTIVLVAIVFSAVMAFESAVTAVE
jgi:protoporphyrinogen IX oxidase